MIIGALEVGGTKMVCAVGDENGTIKEQISIPTLTPQETLPKIKEYFYDKNIEALGIGCFGPIDLKRESKTYGYITKTRSEEHTSELQSHDDLVCRLLLEKKK